MALVAKPILKYLDDWKIICLTTPLNIRKVRIKELYPETYEDHYKNMSHFSETGVLKFPKGTVYLSTDIPMEILENVIIKEIFKV